MSRQIMAKTFFIPAKQGRIVNIIANIFRGFPAMTHTGAARAGVENMTMSLSVEWSRYNIQINAVAPGIIKSTGLENYPPEFLQGIEESIPAKRLRNDRGGRLPDALPHQSNGFIYHRRDHLYRWRTKALGRSIQALEVICPYFWGIEVGHQSFPNGFSHTTGPSIETDL
jgi:NAD(P)-dependent dehydrogenase (short-subunit alcohol dehydrogenase family)